MVGASRVAVSHGGDALSQGGGLHILLSTMHLSRIHMTYKAMASRVFLSSSQPKVSLGLLGIVAPVDDRGLWT